MNREKENSMLASLESSLLFQHAGVPNLTDEDCYCSPTCLFYTTIWGEHNPDVLAHFSHSPPDVDLPEFNMNCLKTTVDRLRRIDLESAVQKKREKWFRKTSFNPSRSFRK
ncbi:hypothetical protein M514_00662 [Trichuris suis]|uniref:Uncharacterized protein n=1 Tax=Trichuris suis TaxID=68888 RepID=A0A085N707_9BILA|nr:hypothetical protein M513_00662 [Trichuris suis]KFD65253.1 hypothetical protein M514_00662 [Trichuris suis]